MRAGDRQRKWPAVLLAGVLVLVLAAGAGKANFWKQDLRVRRIETRGQRIVSASDILSLAGIRAGQRLFALDLTAVRNRIQQNPFIRSVAINREVPDRIVITVSERQPIAAVAADRLVYLDPEGVVLPALHPETTLDLPVLTGSLSGEGWTPGKKIATEPVTGILALLSTAKAVSEELYRRISEVHAEAGRDLLVYMEDGGVPVVFGRDQLGEQCMKLEAFWEQFVALRGGTDLEYVDLRFDGQVVARWRHGQDAAQQGM